MRKQDNMDRDTIRLLEGRLNPPVLLDIILSNHFDGEKFILKKDVSFNVFIDSTAFQKIDFKTNSR